MTEEDPFEKLAAEARDRLKGDGVTDFNAALRAQLENEPEITPPGDLEPVESPGEAEPAPEPAPAAASEQFDIDGVAWTRTQLEAAARFAAAARQAAADPLRAQHLADVLEGRWQPAAEPPAPALTFDVDLEDPTIAYLAQRLDAISQQVSTYTNSQQQVWDDMASRRQAEAASVYTRAKTSFQAEHKLSDDEMTRVSERAAQLGVLKPLSDSGLDLLSAVNEALTLGLRSDDTLYQRDLARAAQDDRDLRTRKAKANSVSAGSGAAPREPSRPADPFAAMVDMVKNDMFPSA